jgi:hypothetical protein
MVLECFKITVYPGPPSSSLPPSPRAICTVCTYVHVQAERGGPKDLYPGKMYVDFLEYIQLFLYSVPKQIGKYSSLEIFPASMG